MLALVVCSALFGAPFEDVHKRFTIDLPDEWEFAPLPGDVGGASFRRQREGILALASVRVTKAAGATLEAVVKRVAAASDKEPGFKLMRQDSEMLAGLPATRRQFIMNIDKEGKLVKMVEQRIAVAGGVAYVVHVESLAEAFGSFEPDFAKLFATFKPQSPESKSQRGSASRAPIVGVWKMAADPTAILELRANGTLQMAGTSGQYRVEGGKLIVWLVGGTSETFHWQLIEGDLILSAASLGDPIRYTR